MHLQHKLLKQSRKRTLKGKAFILPCVISMANENICSISQKTCSKPSNFPRFVLLPLVTVAFILLFKNQLEFRKKLINIKIKTSTIKVLLCDTFHLSLQKNKKFYFFINYFNLAKYCKIVTTHLQHKLLTTKQETDLESQGFYCAHVISIHGQ